MSKAATANNQAEEQEKIVAECKNKLQAEEELIKKEAEWRKKLQDEIDAIFTHLTMRISADKEYCNDLKLPAQIYTDLEKSLEDLKQRLFQEASWARVNNNEPLFTAEKLKETVHTVLSADIPTEEKEKAVDHFYNQARHARLSVETKRKIGFAAGALLSLALLGGLVGTFIALGAVITVAGMVTAGINGVIATLMGACCGADLAGIVSRKQDDSKGREVSSNLHTLVAEKHRLFTLKEDKTKASHAREELTIPASVLLRVL